MGTAGTHHSSSLNAPALCHSRAVSTMCRVKLAACHCKHAKLPNTLAEVWVKNGHVWFERQGTPMQTEFTVPVTVGTDTKFCLLLLGHIFERMCG